MKIYVIKLIIFINLISQNSNSQNMLDLLSLKLFIACVDTGSLTRVSKEQYIALAALSRRITLLEEHYGVILLERTGRGVKATDAGLTLYKKAHDIF
ncbi:LysR family transcriptional regulator (plasmid) [Acinetobacter pittii]|uniref:LysR family transcriptional regulator n=2 Tax=Acinetobacter pittii TaxID=48296 RepID=A0A3G6YM29_ACIPI|nr:LysR family transcriptional regulator [Acinetobacter pittii]